MNLLPRHQTALLRVAAERAQDETQKQVQPQKTQEEQHEVQVIDDDGEKRASTAATAGSRPRTSSSTRLNRGGWGRGGESGRGPCPER